MKLNILVTVVLLSLIPSLTCVGQETKNLISELSAFSEANGIQFAYNPEIFSSISYSSSGPIQDVEDLKVFLETNQIQYQTVDEERWLLRYQPPKVEEIQEKKFQLNGYVKEDGEEPLISALIFTSDSKYSSLTDQDGYFSLLLDDDYEYNICCQFLGYEVECISSKDIIKNILNFELKPKPVSLGNVVIQAKKIQFKVNPILDAEEVIIRNSTLSKSTMGSDVLRSVQILGGVDATNDLKSALQIRSSDDGQSLITLDGIPIYNPESSFGIFSVLNPLVVQNSQLYKNALPLEFGEFTGAYLSCNGLGEIEQNTRFNLDINTLKSAASVKVPLGKSLQISAAFRKSNGDISNEQFYNQLQPKRRNVSQDGQKFTRPERFSTDLMNNFGDAYFNLSYKGKKNTSLSISAFGNRDVSLSSYETFDSIQRGQSRFFDYITETYGQTRTKSNVGMSINYNKKWNNDSKLTLKMYNSQYSLNDGIGINVLIKTRVKEKENSFNTGFQNTIKDSDFKVQYETSNQNFFSWKLGVDLRSLYSELTYKTFTKTPIDIQSRVPSLTPYAGINFNIKDKVYINLGNRTSFLQGDYPRPFISPRANISVKLDEGLFLKGSISHNEQYFRPIEIEQQLGLSLSTNVIANKGKISILRSNQFTTGISLNKGIFKLNGDIYLRRNIGILEQVLVVPGLSDNEDNIFQNNEYQLLNGNNKVFGIDISSFIEYENFTSIFSYTYSKSEDQFAGLFNNQYIPSQNNRLHQMNAFAAYSFDNWTFSSTYVFGTGVYALNRPVLEGNIRRNEIKAEDLLKQLPNYNRMDLNASYKIPVKFGDFHLDFGIFNVFNNNNVNSELDIYSLENDNGNKAYGTTEVNLLNRVWTLGLRFGI